MKTYWLEVLLQESQVIQSSGRRKHGTAFGRGVMNIDIVAPYAKAFIASIVSFLTALSTALADGSINGQEWVTALIALFVGFGAVFAIPNRPPFVPEQDPNKGT